MKNILAGLCFFALSMQAFAQEPQIQAVRWTFSGSRPSPGHFTIEAKATIAPGVRLFSTTMSEDQPNSRVLLDSTAHGRILGIEEKGSLQTSRDPHFDSATVKYFEKEATWIVSLEGQPEKDLKGVVIYMAIKADSFVGPEAENFRLGFGEGVQLISKDSLPTGLTGNVQQLNRSAIDLHHPVKTCGGTGAENSNAKSLWSIFLLGFLGGLIALLTPCVFPMIPLTVSFFTKQAHLRRRGIWNASLYGLFILLIYTLLSVPFYFLDSLNPEILNTISTNVWLNLFFFVVFIAFALSFFGLYEISLPGSLASTVDKRARAGSWAGIFFMALTLALVSFSCTGPILGSLLAGSLSTNGGAVQLTSGMAGFGLALALPFALFAMFPGWLHSLPKSGGWLNSVKIVLGFLEIALAIKFLSNADLVEHWGILKRETFLGSWIVIGLMLVMYLFGFLRFKHDSPSSRPGWPRLGVAIFFLMFTLYLVPGIFKTKYANRSLISGFPPPLSYSIYGKALIQLCGLEADLRNDYQGALSLARIRHKPILIDFTGWACVNCRKMEENVWTDPAVKALISSRFVLVSLYVDDRKSLGDDDQFIFQTKDGHKRPIQTVGDQFATLQSENFVNSSQPLYALISPDEKLLTYPVGYTPNAREYESWLRCGLDAFSSISAR